MKEILGSIYTGVSDDFQRGLFPIFRCVKAENHDLGVVEMEVKQIGNLWGEDTEFDNKTSGRVYDKYGISPTLNTMQGGWKQPMVVDASAVRMVRTEEGKVLRKDYESGVIHHGFNEHREMELREDGISNTLSTVQKDNYICEKSIVAMRGRNPYNPSDRTVGSPTEQRLEPNCQGICNTLTSVQKDNMVMESKIIKVGQISSEGSEYGTVISENGISSNLVAGTHGYANNCIATNYRIRKLTPRECWRLMDFTDEDFEKAAAVNSQTQLYKQAGNSIVVNVLVAILGQMIPGKEDVYKTRCS